MRAGIEWEGEAPPQLPGEQLTAVEIFNTLANGMGGLDWAGLPLMVALHQVQDVEALVRDLQTIKFHEPPKENNGPGHAEH